MIKKIINTIAQFLTLFVYPKRKRQLKRQLLIRNLRTKYYGKQILKIAKSIGEDFACNSYSTVIRNTVIKDYCNFNGMTV